MSKAKSDILFLLGLVAVVTSFVFVSQLYWFVESQHNSFFHNKAKHVKPAKMINHQVNENSLLAKRALDPKLGDWVLQSQYKHDLKRNEIHRFDVPQEILSKKKRSNYPDALAYDYNSFDTSNETGALINRARAMIGFLDNSYTSDSFFDEAEKLAIHNDLKQKIKAANWTHDEKFRGTRIDSDDYGQAGVQIDIFTNAQRGLTVFSFRGTFSTPDLYLNGLWFGDRYKYDLAGITKARWIENGNNADDLSQVDVATWMNRMAYDIAAPGYYSTLKDNLTSSEDLNDIDDSVLERDTYYAITKQMLKDYLPSQANRTVYITGHSLGGALAGLAAMNEAYKGNVYETHLFGSYGHRCIAKAIAGDETGYALQNSYIHSWVTDYDIIPQIDYQSGEICRLGSDPRYYDECVDAYGKGIELTTLGTQNFYDCRQVTHQIQDYLEYMNNETRTNNTLGTTHCTYQAWDESTMCVDGGQPAAYVAFFFFFWFILLLIIIGLVLACVAIGFCIYRKASGNEGPIYPCCCCPCCYIGDRPTFAP